MPGLQARTRTSTHVRDSKVETLLIGGALDLATPPQDATRDLLPHLPNGKEVILRNLGHTDDFWAYRPEASKRLVNTFLDSGRVDASLFKAEPVDFTPAMSQGTIAKIVLGAWLGLAALAALSLLWLPLHMRRRGDFGRKASATLRSIYALVLGLGGWFAGALIALIALPTVPVTDEVLVLISVTVPIALGVYCASSHRNAARFAAIALGAVLGGWLGFHVTSAAFGMLSPFLAIIGATAGANLTLIAVDLARDRQVRDRLVETLEASSSTG